MLSFTCIIRDIIIGIELDVAQIDQAGEEVDRSPVRPQGLVARLVSGLGYGASPIFLYHCV